MGWLATMIRSFTDDCGRPIRLRPIMLPAEDEYDDNRRWEPRTDVAGFALLLVGFGLVLAGLVWNVSCWVTIPFAVVVVGGVDFLLRRVWRLPAFCDRGHQFIHQAVQEGYCPACGDRLADTRQQPDGMVACPHCSAVWRGDRLRDPLLYQDRWERRCRLPQVRRVATLTPYKDHRGRPTNLALFRARRRVEGDYATRCNEAALAIHATVSGRGALMSLLVLAVGAAAFVAVIQSARTSLGASPIIYAVLPIVAFTILGAFMVRCGEVLVRRDTIESETLARGLCPSCWAGLAGLHRGDDGCTMCAECGSSWRVPEPAKCCARCGYRLSGLRPDDRGALCCPECGKVRMDQAAEAGTLEQ